ncbi:MAG: glycosyltransferase family 39 protein [Armatimonadetes bacterium]|nr:glycosyltransferase family 39 protein [Armatimonadota bacterium]
MNRSIALIALVAFRIAYALLATRIDPYLRQDPLHGDSVFHDEMAWILASEGRLEFTKGLQTSPLYIYLMASVYWVFGHAPDAVRVVNAILGVLSAFGAAACARKLFDERIAHWTFWLTALHPQLILLSGWLYTENLVIPLVVWSIWLLWDGSRIRSAILVGLLALTRANLLPLLPLFAIWTWRKEGWKPAGIFLLASALIIAPYVIYISSRFDRFVPISLGGFVLFWSNNPEADGGFAMKPPERIALKGEEVVVADFTKADNWVDGDRKYMDLALAWIKENPTDFASLVWQKTRLTLSPIGLQKPEHRSAKSVLIDFAYWIFLIIAHIGFFVGARVRSRDLWLIAIVWFVSWFFIWLYAGGSRTLLHMAPFMVLFFVRALVLARQPVTARYIETR